MLATVRILAAALLLTGASGTALLAQSNQQPRPNAPARQESRGIDNIVVIARAASGFRQFEVRRGLNFAVGETIFLYGEPRGGFGLSAQPDGRQRLHITVSYEVFNAAGQLVFTNQNPTQLINDFQPGTRNVFMRLATRVPQLADGGYRLQISFRDGFTGGVVSTSRQITIGAAAPAPQAQAPAPQPPTAPQPPAPLAQPPSPPQTAAPAPRAPAAQQQAGIAVDAPVFVQAPPTGFRQFTPRPSNVFAPGEQFHIYFEPRNFRTRFDGRTIQGAMNVDLLVFTASGQLFGRQDANWKLPVSVQSAQDAPLEQTHVSLFANIALPAGSYRLVFRVNDELGGSSAEFTLDMVIQGPPAPQAQAPQAPSPQAQAPQAPAPDTPPRRTGLIR